MICTVRIENHQDFEFGRQTQDSFQEVLSEWLRAVRDADQTAISLSQPHAPLRLCFAPGLLLKFAMH